MSESTFSMEFSKLVAQRREGMDVPADSVTIQDGEACVTVRLAGGYITEGTLDDDGQPLTVLYADALALGRGDGRAPAKIDAPHDMSPAGASDDIGGQHGIYRWANWEVARHDPRCVELVADTPDADYLGMRKSLSLDDNGLTIATTLIHDIDDIDAPIDTSLGHHLYFRTDPQTTERPQIVPLAGPSPLQDQTVFEAVVNGDSHYWSTFEGQATIILPGIGRFLMQSEATLTEDGTTTRLPVGMLLWRRPHTDSICFEPVVGIENDTGQPVRRNAEIPNRQLYMVAGASVTLKTVISLLEDF
jgi:hypothetical protein